MRFQTSGTQPFYLGAVVKGAVGGGIIGFVATGGRARGGERGHQRGNLWAGGEFWAHGLAVGRCPRAGRRRYEPAPGSTTARNSSATKPSLLTAPRPPTAIRPWPRSVPTTAVSVGIRRHEKT